MTDIMPGCSSPAGLKLQSVPPFLSASCDVVKVGLSLRLSHTSVTVGAQTGGGNTNVEAVIMS